MRIGIANARDVVAITALMTSSPLLRRYRITSRGARASLIDARSSRDLLLVAREPTGIAGLAWIVFTRALDRAAYLRLLLIAEARQSRGVGAELLAEGERRARKHGCRHMLLLVTTTNRRARAFYRRHGYRYVGSLPEFVASGIDEALYVKNFSAGD